MTSTAFRQNTELVSNWRELLTSNPVVAQVLVTLRDEKPSAVALPGTDALERTAALARLEQHDFDYSLLLSLAEPLAPEPTEEQMTWGVDAPNP